MINEYIVLNYIDKEIEHLRIKVENNAKIKSELQGKRDLGHSEQLKIYIEQDIAKIEALHEIRQLIRNLKESNKNNS